MTNTSTPELQAYPLELLGSEGRELDRISSRITRKNPSDAQDHFRQVYEAVALHPESRAATDQLPLPVVY